MRFWSVAAVLAHLFLFTMHRFGDRWLVDSRHMYRQLAAMLLSFCCFPFVEAGALGWRWVALSAQATVLTVAVVLHRQSPQRWDN